MVVSHVVSYTIAPTPSRSPPPGTCVSIELQDSLLWGTIQNVPLPFTPNVKNATTDAAPPPDEQSTTYTILLNDSSTINSTFEDLSKVGRSNAPTTLPPSDGTFEGLPSFIQPNSKVTLDHNGAYHKCVIHYTSNNA